MKPLVPALFSLLLFCGATLQAQMTAEYADSLKELKKKFGKEAQKPVMKTASATETAPVPDDAGVSIADLEALLLKTPGCKKDPKDTELLAADLKGKYSLVSCYDEIDGWRQIVLVPKSPAYPGQQLAYASILGHKLLRARLVDHYLVLQFDTQTQYLDLIKQDKSPDGLDAGFALAGFIADESLSRFEDIGLFKDALLNYAGFAKSSELLAKLPSLVAKTVGTKRFRLAAFKAKGDWMVTVTSDGNITRIWPEGKQP